MQHTVSRPRHTHHQHQIRSRQCHPTASSTVNLSAKSRRGLQCHASVVWRQLERSKAWLTHPRSARTKGVIHFLGGAFAGAAPQLLYNTFIEQLADAGWTVISTPYKVTFQHDVCARQVRQAFLDSLSELRATGRSYLVPPKAPQFGVGHSNGALLQLLINSYEPGANDANVIISYNNLQVSDAIPIPGFLDTLQPTVQAARAANNSTTTTTSSSGSSSSVTSSTEEVGAATAVSSQQQLLAAAAASLPLAEQQAMLLAGAAPALEQLSSVVNEVGDGLTDFTPSPEESRAIIRAGYACPATLLLQFENDNFDETPEMQQLLLARQAAAGAAADSVTRGTDPAAVTAASSATAAGMGGVSQEGSSVSQSTGYTSAWNSIDEDVSLDNLLQQLQELQSSLQQQEQQQPGQDGGATSSNGLQPQPQALQQMVLQGSHITPCGADLQASLATPIPPPFVDVLPGGGASNSPADLQNLVRQVLGFLEGRRGLAVKRRAGMMQQQQAQAQVESQGAGSSTGEDVVPAVVAAVATAADTAVAPASS